MGHGNGARSHRGPKVLRTSTTKRFVAPNQEWHIPKLLERLKIKVIGEPQLIAGITWWKKYDGLTGRAIVNEKGISIWREGRLVLCNKGENIGIVQVREVKLEMQLLKKSKFMKLFFAIKKTDMGLERFELPS